MSGLKLAAFYSLRPHELGLCGPEKATQQKLLRRFLQGRVSTRKIRVALKKFIGAYQYYRLIAKSNEMKDPFDEKVVAAYWIGNKLLDEVKIDNLRRMIAKNFSGKGLLTKEIAEKKAKLIPESSKPHHSFHVLTIGSVTGSVDFKNTKLKDLCRIGWGKVKKLKIKNEKLKIIVEYQPLVGEKKIKLGKPVKKEIFWDKEIVPEVKIGDWVSFHWNWLVQSLKKKEVANLEKYTLKTLESLRATQSHALRLGSVARLPKPIVSSRYLNFNTL